MKTMEPYNPFANNSFNMQFVAFQLSEIIKLGVGFDSSSLTFIPDENVKGVMVKEATDNPFIVDKMGQKKFYQRELCWGIIDKMNLIDAIYNYSDIGKFVVARRSYEYLEMKIKQGYTKGLSFHELIDGKQRINAIVEFMQDKFHDSNGKYYSEFDQHAKCKFTQYNKCTIAIIEHATPAQIKRAFLNVNHTGKAMSSEHIEMIKDLNV